MEGHGSVGHPFSFTSGQDSSNRYGGGLEKKEDGMEGNKTNAGCRNKVLGWRSGKSNDTRHVDVDDTDQVRGEMVKMIFVRTP